jgi:hypothetical protein
MKNLENKTEQSQKSEKNNTQETKAILIPFSLSAEEALKQVKAHFGIGKNTDEAKEIKK